MLVINSTSFLICYSVCWIKKPAVAIGVHVFGALFKNMQSVILFAIKYTLYYYTGQSGNLKIDSAIHKIMQRAEVVNGWLTWLSMFCDLIHC